MAFTASHYKETARILRDQTEHHTKFCGDPNSGFNEGARWATRVVSENLAGMFKRQNPKFDVARFLKDCQTS
jgi:hypothetical protein